MNGSVIIKRGREKPIVNQHPWIFSGAVERVEGNPTPGDIVTVKAQDGKFLARGYWNPKSQIQVRILTWQDEAIDEDWWRRMLRRAIDARINDEMLGLDFVTGFRLVNAENDYIPGLIVDKYGDWLVIQALTLGIDLHKTLLATILSDSFPEWYKEGEQTIRGIYERSDVEVRDKEGLKPSAGLIMGDEPPERIIIKEYGIEHYVGVRGGHKTGFYLDQRENRSLLGDLLLDWFSLDQSPRHILNLFSYTGSFGLVALQVAQNETKPSVRITNLDSSYEVLDLAEENVKLNALPLNQAQFIQGDAFYYLRDAVARNEQFDVIVCDPPKFAHNQQQVEKAARGYKDLNLHCFKLIKPGGYLMTFSCSGAVSADLFQKIVFGALADSGRQAQILRHLGPGDDHPVALTFPEGAYLKGLLLRVY